MAAIVAEPSYGGWIVGGLILFLVIIWLIILTYFEFLPNVVNIIQPGGTTVVVNPSLDTYAYGTGNTFSTSGAGDFAIPLPANQILRNITVSGDGTQYFIPAGVYEYNYSAIFSETVNVNVYLTGSALSSTSSTEIGDFNAAQWSHSGLFTSTNGGYVSLWVHTTGPVTLNTTGLGASLTLVRIHS